VKGRGSDSDDTRQVGEQRNALHVPLIRSTLLLADDRSITDLAIVSQIRL
jgi:hypothetical protein